jgi:chlorite dismutase
MTDHASRRAHAVHPVHAAVSPVYHHFGFYRIDPAYRRLLPNEKLVAKQEFLSVIESFNHRIILLNYSLLGLRGDCDLLLWRVGGDMEALQEMAARAFAAGIGKYLTPSRSFLGATPSSDAAHLEDSPRFLFLQPLSRTNEWRALPPAERKRLLDEEAALAKRFGDVRVRLIPAFGIEEHDVIVAAETARPQALLEFSQALKSSTSAKYLAPLEPTYSCIRHDLSDVLEHLG